MRRVTERCSGLPRSAPLVQKLGSCYFALIVDASMLLLLSQYANHGSAEVGLLLDGFLLFSAAVATASNSPLLLLPNLIARAILLTSLLFFSCFAVDVLLRPDETLQILPNVREAILDHPQIAYLSIIFSILLIIEFKLFVQVWRNLEGTTENTEIMTEKPPPPYSVCLEDTPPKYEEILKSLPSTSKRNYCPV